MEYLSHYHALNTTSNEALPHKFYKNIDWKEPSFKSSETSIFKDFGIEKDMLIKKIGKERTYNKANHFRALLDILEDRSSFVGSFSLVATSIFEKNYKKEDFFEKVLLLYDVPHWDFIADNMLQTFSEDWIDFIKNNKNVSPKLLSEIFPHLETTPLCEEKIDLAKQFIAYMGEKNRHDFILNGALALKLCYDFPIKPSKIEIMAKNSSTNYELMEEFCASIGYTLKVRKPDKNVLLLGLLGAYELKFNTEKKVLSVFQAPSPTPEQVGKFHKSFFLPFSSSLQNDKFKTKYKTFKIEIFMMLLIDEYNEKGYDIERLYCLSYLYNNYKDKIKGIREIFMDFVRKYGLSHFNNILKTHNHSLIEKKLLISEFIKALEDEKYADHPIYSIQFYETEDLAILEKYLAELNEENKEVQL